MFVKKIKTKDKTHLYLVESYRIDGKIKHRTVKSLGILEEMQKDCPGEDVIEKLNKEYKSQKELPRIEINSVNTERTGLKNYGYYFLEAVYEKLGISKFLTNYQKNVKLNLI